MSTKINPAIPKLGLKYGLVGGIMAIISFLLFFYLDQQPWRNLISFILDIIIIGVFSFLPIKDFKSSFNGEELRFYHGMTIGFISYLAISFSFMVFYTGFINWIEPEFIVEYKAIQKEDMINMKDLILAGVEDNPEEFFEGQLEMVESITKSQLILDVFLKKVVIGLFLTPIFSIVLRTRQRQ